jgi:hypothetical protein
MKGFTEFKKVIGYSGKTIEEITGYTRQGLHFIFSNMAKGIKPQKKTLVCINAAITERIQEETRAYELRMYELRELQEKLIGNEVFTAPDGMDYQKDCERTGY